MSPEVDICRKYLLLHVLQLSYESFFLNEIDGGNLAGLQKITIDVL